MKKTGNVLYIFPKHHLQELGKIIKKFDCPSGWGRDGELDHLYDSVWTDERRMSLQLNQSHILDNVVENGLGIIIPPEAVEMTRAKYNKKETKGKQKTMGDVIKFSVGDSVYISSTRGKRLPGTIVRGKDSDGDYRVNYVAESGETREQYVSEVVLSERKVESQGKEEVMTKTKQVATAVVDKNKEAATLAAEVVAGQTVNQKIKDTLAPLIGDKGKELMEGPFGNLLVANLVSTAVEIYPNDERLNRASECLLKAAYIDGAAELKVKDKLLGFLDGIKLPGLDSKETK